MASAASDRPQSVTAPAAGVEALGSALLCGGTFAIVRLFGDAALDQQPMLAIGRALAVGVVAFTVWGVLGATRTLFVPNGAFAGLVRERLSHDDAIFLIGAQLVGAAVVGVVLGAAHRQPIATVPDLWSLNNLGELAAACGLALAARAGRLSAVWASAVVAIAMLAGVRYLGNPALLIGDAFAGTPNDAGMKIGAPLAAQTLGIVLGVVLPRGGSTVEVADRLS